MTAIVDYAHTPDALRNVIDTIDEIRGKDRKLYVVVGCGGNRDRTKRPEMARIAADGADLAVLTSDNPRKEDPEAILAEMKAGLDASSRYLCIADRREAIKAAVALARPGDIVLVAGKGHETYQDVGGVKHHFDDREEVRRAMGLGIEETDCDMKRLLLLLPLLCTAVAARDPSALGMRVDTIVAGRDTVTGERLSAVRYGFTSRYAVSGFDARPEGDWAICQLSKLAPMCKYIQSFGKLIGWDMRTGEVRWAQDVRYPGGGAYQNSVRLCGDVLVQSDGLRNRCFDATSGELLSENRYGLYYLSDAGIALGYDKVRPQQLKGIDLRTGEELWTRELKFHGDRWNQAIAGDSAVLISAAGLHWVGLYSGQGWDRPLRTFRNSLSDTKHPLTSNVILSGSMLSEPVLFRRPATVCSHSISGGTFCGRPRCPMASRAYRGFHETDTTVVLVNKGVAGSAYGPVPYGLAYMAIFAKQDGRMTFFKGIGETKEDAVYFSIPWSDDRLLLAGKKRIALYAKNGELLAENTLATVSEGEIHSVYSDECDWFAPESGGFRPVVDREDEWAIRTDDGWLAVLDDSLRIRRQYVTDALIFCFARVGDLSVLYDKELTRLVGSGR